MDTDLVAHNVVKFCAVIIIRHEVCIVRSATAVWQEIAIVQGSGERVRLVLLGVLSGNPILRRVGIES